ncbi:MAG: class I SAM-dependent methyltransferase [Oscillospiraceae bacterium]|nr:class I SAM-dependent methyltransferase [Oscillospiraceae bacterium]MBR2890158.1 class I SAM-dependent methyltransferase [Oscillospiraceae bacterium]
MYSEVFCKVYNEFGWNYYPEIFGELLLTWLKRNNVTPKTAMDLACGTGILCRILRAAGMEAAGMDLSDGMIAIAWENDPQGQYTVADMTTFRPADAYDLVTCTGDAVNHIPELGDVRRIFENVYSYLAPGGYFVFDLLNEKEVSDSEPFEMDFTETTRVWFQMTRPGQNRVHLTVRVYESGVLALEEVIRETIHDPGEICRMLQQCGFRVIRCADCLLEDSGHGTTWFIVARKEHSNE